MSEPDLKQRLAAILAADAEGYSRLMAADERATVAALDAARAVFRKHVEAHQGRIVDTAGDSVLAVFETASGAVTAGLAIQQELAGAAATEDRRLRFRVGIHLGDVIEKPDGTVYGDGVNVAARLQSLADPGGISVSEAVQASVRNRADASFEDCGEQPVKNIPYPVRTFRLNVAYGRRAPGSAKRAPSPAASIAVLAFDNMCGDPEQDLFCDGISEDIITDLSRINGIAVIGRQSSFVYKGKANDLRKIGRELGVRYVLEGSVRRASNRVRVTAQLIEAESGTQVWANRYDRDVNDSFMVGDDITEDIVTSLDIKIGRGEEARVFRKAVRSPEARTVFYRGLEAYYRSTQDTMPTAREYFLEAIRIEPESASAHGYAAITHILEVMHGWSRDAAKSLSEAKRLSTRSIELDGTLAAGYYARGFVDMFEGNYETALADAQGALERRPMCSGPRAGLAYVETYTGRCDQAIQHARDAITLNPVAPGWYLYLAGAAEYFGGRAEQALAALDRALEANPRLLLARVLRIGALSELGRRNEANAEVAAVLQANPGFSLARFASTQPFKDLELRSRYLNTLREAGLPA